MNEWIKKISIGGGIGLLIALLFSPFSPLGGSKTTDVQESSFVQPIQSEEEGYERTDDYSTERSYTDYGDMDCSDFSSQSEAQEFFESEGGPSSDYHNLDRDGDGYVCETL